MPSRFISSHHLASERSEPAVVLDGGVFLIAGGVGPTVGVGMGQGHVPDAEIVVVAQQAQTVFNGMAAFHAEQCGDLAAAMCGLDVVRGERENERVRMTADDVVLHRVDHLQGAMRGLVGLHILRIDIHREELRSHATGAQPGDIGVAVGAAGADVEAVHGPAGDVVVGVDEECAAMDSLDFRIAHLMGREQQKAQTNRTQNGDSVHESIVSAMLSEVMENPPPITIRAEHLTREIGGRAIVRDVSLEVQARRVAGDRRTERVGEIVAAAADQPAG